MDVIPMALKSCCCIKLATYSYFPITEMVILRITKDSYQLPIDTCGQYEVRHSSDFALNNYGN